MNTQTTTHVQMPGATASGGASPLLDGQTPQGEQLSALFDGECSMSEVAALTQAYGASAELQQAWARYELLGESLRGATRSSVRVARPDFVAAVMAGIQDSAAQAPDTVRPAPPPVAVAPQMAPTGSVPAANDAVFRWKMVAGVSSLFALATLVWQVTVAPASSTGPQLAQLTPPVVATSPAPAVFQAVVTERGVMLRDPQIEELMAAHRQHGGMSALQMPAGFLRNATYDVPQR